MKTRLGALRAGLRRLCKSESGAVLAFLVMIPVVAGTLAVGMETGQWFRVKRQLQNAADAAALAGSIDRIAGKNSTTIETTARYEAQRNGFVHGVSNVVVTVNAPPTSGANATTAGAVEVVITKSLSLSFGAIIYGWMNQSSSGPTLRARAVAAQGSSTSMTSSAEGCLVALTTAAEQGINFTSFNNFNADCTLVSNGTSSSANSSASIYLASFNNATVKSVWSRGSFYKTGYNSFSTTNEAQLNQTTAVVDPYAGLANPSPGTCTYNPFSGPGGSQITLTPGTYCGGLTVSGYNNVYFTAGTYYIANGDLRVTGSNNVSCTNCTGGAGVTFVLTQTTNNTADIGGVAISSENNISFSAPSSGQYAGVLFYQDRRAPTGTMTSTTRNFTVTSLNNVTLNGAVYFPSNRIEVSSVNNIGASATCTVWIGRYIKFSSYNNTSIAGCASFGTTPATIVTNTTTVKNRLFE